MSTSTRLTYDLYTCLTIFTKLTHVSINSHAKSTSLLRFLLHLSQLQIRYAFISFTHLYYTPRPFTLYFNVFITTCFTQNAFQTLSLTLSFTRSYLHIHATSPCYFLLYFTLFLPRLHAANEVFKRFLIVSDKTSCFPSSRWSSRCSSSLFHLPQPTSPDRSSKHARRQFILKETNRHNL